MIKRLFKITTCLTLAGLITSCQTTSAPSASKLIWPKSSPAVTSALFARAGITVNDMEESLTFYRDTLGMTVLLDRLGKSDQRLQDYMGLTADQSVRLVIMRTETVGDAQLNAGYISLAEITDADGASVKFPNPQLSSGAEPGAIMLMFVVESVDTVHKKAIESGYKVISAPLLRKDGFWTELLMRGPSGERLWITQRYDRSVMIKKSVG